jgi:hypothetical protein
LSKQPNSDTVTAEADWAMLLLASHVNETETHKGMPQSADPRDFMVCTSAPWILSDQNLGVMMVSWLTWLFIL